MAESASRTTNPEDFNFPVYCTERGGFVQIEPGGKSFVFVTKPNCAGFDIGDEMPSDWEILPANKLAGLNDDDLAGKANCGCVWHAEQGIPCPHDLALAGIRRPPV